MPIRFVGPCLYSSTNPCARDVGSKFELWLSVDGAGVAFAAGGVTLRMNLGIANHGPVQLVPGLHMKPTQKVPCVARQV